MPQPLRTAGLLPQDRPRPQRHDRLQRVLPLHDPETEGGDDLHGGVPAECSQGVQARRHRQNQATHPQPNGHALPQSRLRNGPQRVRSPLFRNRRRLQRTNRHRRTHLLPLQQKARCQRNRQNGHSQHQLRTHLHPRSGRHLCLPPRHLHQLLPQETQQTGTQSALLSAQTLTRLQQALLQGSALHASSGSRPLLPAGFLDREAHSAQSHQHGLVRNQD